MEVCRCGEGDMIGKSSLSYYRQAHFKQSPLPLSLGPLPSPLSLPFVLPSPVSSGASWSQLSPEVSHLLQHLPHLEQLKVGKILVACADMKCHDILTTI